MAHVSSGASHGHHYGGHGGGHYNKGRILVMGHSIGHCTGRYMIGVIMGRRYHCIGAIAIEISR